MQKTYYHNSNETLHTLAHTQTMRVVRPGANDTTKIALNGDIVQDGLMVTSKCQHQTILVSRETMFHPNNVVSLMQSWRVNHSFGQIEEMLLFPPFCIPSLLLSHGGITIIPFLWPLMTSVFRTEKKVTR